MMISRGWFRWLCATRHQPIIWANVDPVLCHHMSSPDHNELTWMISENDCSLTQFLSKFGIYKTCISAFCRTRAACVDFTYQLPYTLCWYGSERTVTAKLRQSWSFWWCQSRDIMIYFEMILRREFIFPKCLMSTRNVRRTPTCVN